MLALPEIAVGVAGIDVTVTDNVCPMEEPQELSAVTVMFPLVALAVVLIELVTELPVHPEGNVHV